nr:hypothetical protein [Bacillus sp. SH5-2]
MVGSGSGVALLTTAVFVINPVADPFTVPLRITVCEAAVASVPRLIKPGHGLNVIPPSIEYSGFKISLGTASERVTS